MKVCIYIFGAMKMRISLWPVNHGQIKSTETPQRMNRLCQGHLGTNVKGKSKDGRSLGRNDWVWKVKQWDGAETVQAHLHDWSPLLLAKWSRKLLWVCRRGWNLGWTVWHWERQNVQKQGSKNQQPGFKFSLYHLIAMWHPVSLNFLKP